MWEIYNLDEVEAMLMMKRGLRSSRFTYLLDKTYTKSYLELLNYAKKYICMEKGALGWWEANKKPRKNQA